MEVTATLRKLRIAPRKVQLVADSVRGLAVTQAEGILTKLNKHAAVPVLKLIQSAAANATHNHNLQKDQLYIKTIRVDEGVTLHRWRPRAFGRAAPIRKRSSHVLVVLDVKAEAKAAARTQVREKDIAEAKKDKTEAQKPAAVTVKENPAEKNPAEKKNVPVKETK